MTSVREPTWNATLLWRRIWIGDDLPRADYDRTRQQRPRRAITVAGPHTATIKIGALRATHIRVRCSEETAPQSSALPNSHRAALAARGFVQQSFCNAACEVGACPDESCSASQKPLNFTGVGTVAPSDATLRSAFGPWLR